MRILSEDGERLYINEEERFRFEAAAKEQKRNTMTLALVILYTGCRISEALNVQYKHIDISNKALIFESLKKRKKGIFRSVPIPKEICDYLELVHEVKRNNKPNGKVWPIARNTAFLQLRKIFVDADIDGKKACAKGLRHGFAIHALTKKIQINMVQKWMGHSQMSTTAIYANAIDEEERDIAQRMW